MAAHCINHFAKIGNRRIESGTRLLRRFVDEDDAVLKLKAKTVEPLDRAVQEVGVRVRSSIVPV